jgi:hypothetical protein
MRQHPAQAEDHPTLIFGKNLDGIDDVESEYYNYHKAK